MRSNLLAGGLMACGAGCLALAAVPGLALPAEAACALGAGIVAGGLLLWKPKPKAPEA